MLKLKIKKGLTLIEVLCSITIFSIIILLIISIQLSSIKIKKYSNDIYNYSIFMEELKNVIINNTSYEELKNISLENKYFISKENIRIEKIKEIGITNIFVSNIEKQEPYLVINIEGDEVLKVKLELHTKPLKKEKVMECEFYKGTYKR
ncbi:prepilin-type N-terminal cleavage/methylation domain-containing protein [Clostridium sp. DJ247]|uniref:prepilin-type N-terminal cleavage/methylation domain-containing protein n=1 Tax=Clostridium sp. DJ247 TaxID=2726188 RepID=UPI00162766EB|nr:prepilin-type N-terminal cleavage/methylation domain-containing protein [Clostridium sp. DJ247]MBC2580311.1 prepilin-type N-terminal cleavage/methylation domain-containing protein [Clostridium sp. DJ247]